MNKKASKISMNEIAEKIQSKSSARYRAKYLDSLVII